MKQALYDAVAFGMRYWFLLLVALILFTLIVVSIRDYRQKKSVKGIVGQYIGYLEVLSGSEDSIGLRIGLRKENLLGSGKRSDILIEDASVAKSHALIYLKDGRLILSPLGNTSTKINGRKAIRAHEIFTDDVLSFGEIELKVFLKHKEEEEHDD